jgi:uncharacterized OsmC-like protein
MGQREIGAAINAAIDYLNANPADARYTDSPATATLRDTESLAVDVSGPQGARLTTDMPTSVGGGNTATSPGWYLRAAEASCVATLIAMRAAQLGVGLTSVEVTVDSESDDRGILGADASVPGGPLSTRVAAKVMGAADHDELAAIVHWAVEHCPVTDAVRRAIPMTVDVQTIDGRTRPKEK